MGLRAAAAIAAVTFLSLVFPPAPSQARTVHGTLETIDSWKYLDRFVFVPTSREFQSRLRFSFKFPVQMRPTLLTYYDQTSINEDKNCNDDLQLCATFSRVYESKESCQWRDNEARKHGNAFDLSSEWPYWWSEDGKGAPFNIYENLRENEGSWFQRAAGTAPPSQAKYIFVNASLNFRSSRKRWFYFAISNCVPSGLPSAQEIQNRKAYNNSHFDLVQNPLTEKWSYICKEGVFCQGPVSGVEYYLQMRNADVETYPTLARVSADEWRMLEVCCIFFFIYLILVAVFLYMACMLRRRKLLHHTFKLVVASASMAWISLMLRWGYRSWVANNPYFESRIEGDSYLMTAADGDATAVKIAADMFDILSHLLLLLSIMLLAKGWTIVRAKISAMGRVRISVYMTTYSCTLITAYSWSEWGFDPALIIYKYESPPGELYVWIRLFSVVWFLYACSTTLRNYPTKSTFYRVFCFLFTLWLLAVPLSSIIITNVIPPWYRAISILVIEQITQFLAHSALIFIFWPSRFNRMFPFHATVTAMTSATSRASGGLASKSPGKHGFASRTGSLSGRSRVNITGGGGAGFEDPIKKARQLANSLRFKLMQLQDYSDDLVEALTGLDDGLDDHSHVDLPVVKGELAIPPNDPPPSSALNRANLAREFELAASNREGGSSSRGNLVGAP